MRHGSPQLCECPPQILLGIADGTGSRGQGYLARLFLAQFPHLREGRVRVVAPVQYPRIHRTSFPSQPRTGLRPGFLAHLQHCCLPLHPGTAQGATESAQHRQR